MTGKANDNETNIFEALTNKELQFELKVPKDEAETEKFIFEHGDCIEAENTSGAYWMINKCPDGFEDSHTAHKCEKGRYYGLDNLPIEWTDSGGRIWLFKNIFCSICHGLRLGDTSLETWEPFMECFNKDDKTTILSGHINLYDIPPSCTVSFRPSTKISDVYQRKCDRRAQQTVTCNSSEFQSLCDSYIHYVIMDIVREDNTIDSISFRNPHCAMCISETSNYFAPCTTYGKIEGSGFAVDLKLMFDFDPDTGFNIKATCHANMDCLSFEIFDCFSSRCRPLICQSEKIPLFGKCIESNTTLSDEVWYDVNIPQDNENESKTQLFIQIEIISSEQYPIETLTEWLQNMSYIERVVDIVVEQKYIKPKSDGTDEENDEQAPGFQWRDTVPDDEGPGFEMPTEDTETHVHERSVMEEQKRAFGNDNTDRNQTDLDVVNDGNNVDTEETLSENIPNEEIDSVTNEITESQITANDETGTISNDATAIETEDDNGGVSVHNDDANEYLNDDNSHTTIDENEWGETPSEGNGGVHFQYIVHAKLVSKTRSIDAAKELVNKINDLQMLSDANFKITANSFSDLENLSCTMGNLTVMFNASYDSNMMTVTLPTFGNVSVDDIQWAMSDVHSAKQMFQMAIVCLTENRIPDMNCNMTFYQMGEVYFQNDKMHVRNVTLTFERNDYIKVGHRIFVCVDKLIQPSYVRFFEYSELQKYLSIITSAFSLICLTVICLMHVIFPKMRNNHGLNIFALSLTMLLVQALLLVQELPGGTPCYIYAVVLHFLVLLMFVWMNIIGYDMTITFYTKSMASNKTNYCRFSKYCIISVFVALLFIGIGILLDENNSKYGPSYGEVDICWLTSSVSIIIFFIAPICASISVNIIMFAIILYSIQSAKIKSTVRTNSRNRAYTVVYFKLSIILGFTWVVGVIAAFVSVGWLWYVHIVLNGLQGLSLFICSVVNARAVRLMREKTQTISFGDTRSSKLNNSSKSVG